MTFISIFMLLLCVYASLRVPHKPTMTSMEYWLQRGLREQQERRMREGLHN